jgi:hypothetical protein
MGLVVRTMGGFESYMRAFPPVVGKFKVHQDLFEGI